MPQDPLMPQTPQTKAKPSIDEWEEQVRQKYNIPQKLWRGLAAQESGGDRNAVSPTGVRGKYQVTESTAKSYGLDRNDPYQQAEAAAKHLRKLYDATPQIKSDSGRWWGAVAKYYGGDNAVDEQGNFSDSSVDGVSTPLRHVNSLARRIQEMDKQSPSVVNPQNPAAPVVAPAPKPTPMKARPKPVTTARGPIVQPTQISPLSFTGNAAPSSEKLTAQSQQIAQQIRPEIQAKQPKPNPFEQRSPMGQFGEMVGTGALRAAEHLNKAASYVAPVVTPWYLKGLQKGMPAPGESLLSPAAQNALKQQEVRQDESYPNAAPVVRGITQGAIEAPAYMLGGAAGTIPAMATAAGLAAIDQDWQNDPKRAAVRTALGSVLPVAGGKALSNVAGRVAPNLVAKSLGGRAVETVGGALGNVAPAAAEQLYYDRELNLNELGKQAVIGGALGFGTYVHPQAKTMRARPEPHPVDVSRAMTDVGGELPPLPETPPPATQAEAPIPPTVLPEVPPTAPAQPTTRPLPPRPGEARIPQATEGTRGGIVPRRPGDTIQRPVGPQRPIPSIQNGEGSMMFAERPAVQRGMTLEGKRVTSEQQARVKEGTLKEGDYLGPKAKDKKFGTYGDIAYYMFGTPQGKGHGDRSIYEPLGTPERAQNIHGHDAVFHDPEVKGALGLSPDAQMGPVKEALNEDMARWMGLPTDKVSLAQIKPETWLGWARMKGLSAPVIAKMNKAISDASAKQRRDLTPQPPQTPMAMRQSTRASEGPPMPFEKRPVAPPTIEPKGQTNVEETPAARAVQPEQPETPMRPAPEVVPEVPTMGEAATQLAPPGAKVPRTRKPKPTASDRFVEPTRLAPENIPPVAPAAPEVPIASTLAPKTRKTKAVTLPRTTEPESVAVKPAPETMAEAAPVEPVAKTAPATTTKKVSPTPLPGKPKYNEATLREAGFEKVDSQLYKAQDGRSLEYDPDHSVWQIKRPSGEGTETFGTQKEAIESILGKPPAPVVEAPIRGAKKVTPAVTEKAAEAKGKRAAKVAATPKEVVAEKPVVAEVKPAETPVEPAKAGLSNKKRVFSESLAEKYGTPVAPITAATEPHESISRFSDMLERAARKSTDDTELKQILSQAKGLPQESRIASAIEHNPNASDSTFADAQANPALKRVATDNSLVEVARRRQESKKQQTSLPETTPKKPPASIAKSSSKEKVSERTGMTKSQEKFVTDSLTEMGKKLEDEPGMERTIPKPKSVITTAKKPLADAIREGQEPKSNYTNVKKLREQGYTDKEIFKLAADNEEFDLMRAGSKPNIEATAPRNAKGQPLDPSGEPYLKGTDGEYYTPQVTVRKVEATTAPAESPAIVPGVKPAKPRQTLAKSEDADISGPSRLKELKAKKAELAKKGGVKLTFGADKEPPPGGTIMGGGFGSLQSLFEKAQAKRAKASPSDLPHYDKGDDYVKAVRELADKGKFTPEEKTLIENTAKRVVLGAESVPEAAAKADAKIREIIGAKANPNVTVPKVGAAKPAAAAKMAEAKTKVAESEGVSESTVSDIPFVKKPKEIRTIPEYIDHLNSLPASKTGQQSPETKAINRIKASLQKVTSAAKDGVVTPAMEQKVIDAAESLLKAANSRNSEAIRDAGIDLKRQVRQIPSTKTQSVESPLEFETAQEYLGYLNAKKSPQPKPDTPEYKAMAKAKRALQAVTRMKRDGAVDPEVESRIVSAADDLIQASKSGDADAISKAQTSLTDAFPAKERKAQTAEEYFADQLEKDIWHSDKSGTANKANAEARAALAEAAAKFRRKQITDEQKERIVGAAQDLMLAGKLGDDQLITDARKALKNASLNDSRAAKIWEGIKTSGRTIQTLRYGTDWSLGFKQAGPLTTNIFNVVDTAKAFKYAAGASKSQNRANEIHAVLESHPRYADAQKSGLELTLFGKHEEVYQDNPAMKVPWIKRLEAGNNALVDYMRLQEFGKMTSAIDKQSGLTEVQKADSYKRAAEVINTLTGRTNLGEGKLQQVATALNGIMASPRLNISRFKMADPLWIPKMYAKDPVVAKQMFRQAMGVASTWMGLYALGATTGAFKVVLNPNDSDFGKVVIGKTRYDITGGMLPVVKILLQYGRLGHAIANEAYENTDESKAKRQAVWSKTAYDTTQFLRGRLGPLYGYATDIVLGKDFEKRSVTLRSTVNPTDPNFAGYRLVPPLGVTGAYESYQMEGMKGVAKTAIPEFVGIGARTYGQRPGYIGRDSRVAQEMDDVGLPASQITRMPKEPNDVYKNRTLTVDKWTTTYGERLINSPEYKAMSNEMKVETLKELRSRITAESRKAYTKGESPDLNKLAPSTIMTSVTAAQKRLREKKPREFVNTVK